LTIARKDIHAVAHIQLS